MGVHFHQSITAFCPTIVLVPCLFFTQKDTVLLFKSSFQKTLMSPKISVMGSVLWHSELSHCLCHQHLILEYGLHPGRFILSQLPANALGKVAEL